MNSLRFRISLLMFLTTASAGGLIYMLGTTFWQYRTLNSNFRESHWLIEEAHSLKNREYSEKKKLELQEIRKRLAPPHRAEALSHVIAAYSDRNGYLLQRRIKFLEQTEDAYRKHIEPIIAYLEKRMLYYGAIHLGLCLLFYAWLSFYLNASTFKPLRGLYKKMVDFLNDRYTYQFSVPKPNEIGNLQATFNALAQRVIQNIDALQALDNAKSEFLSIASHELRTPLTSIKGSLSLLRGGLVGDLPEQGKSLVVIAEQETDRLIRLINDLLDLAKIEARKFPLNLKWTSLETILTTTFSSLEGFAKTANVKLEHNLQQAIEVHADADRIQQVLTNLLSNAIKYSPPGGRVMVSAQVTSQQQVQIEVTDQGKGIAPEDQELIFQKFRQATSPESPLVKGTGLGLAIAQALVEEHEGQIGVTSSPGKGSTFFFILPKWRPLYQKPAKEKAA